MRLASFNLENLFCRAKALDLSTWAEGRPILDAYTRLNKLLNKNTYTNADKTAILEGLNSLGLLKKDDGGEFAVLRQNRGRLLKRPRNASVQVIANGRADWIGWIELKETEVNEVALENTAQVIRDVSADVMAVVEVDNRIAVKRFNEQLLPRVGATAYEHTMVIDGNDDRGIDVGIVTRAGYGITGICSHVDDLAGQERIFSRDCAEYEIETPSGNQLLVLVNHFKSKGYGGQAASNAKRKKQAQRVREIVEERLAEGTKLIAVVGDLNDTPDSDALSPLLSSNILRDVSEHPKYTNDGRPGTYANGTKSQKIDYILLSSALFQRVTGGGVFRRGVWGGVNGTLWPIYPEMKKSVDAASDHAAIWVDLKI